MIALRLVPASQNPRAGRDLAPRIGRLPMVNNGPPARWPFSVHLCHSVSGWPRRPCLRSDPMMLQRLVETDAAPAGRAGGAKKWHKVAVFGAFFEHPYTGVFAPHSALSTRHSALIGLSSAIVPASVRSMSRGRVDCRPFRRGPLIDCAPFSPSIVGLARTPPTDVPASPGLTMRFAIFFGARFGGLGGRIAV
jgi:hypothetical protein